MHFTTGTDFVLNNQNFREFCQVISQDLFQIDLTQKTLKGEKAFIEELSSVDYNLEAKLNQIRS